MAVQILDGFWMRIELKNKVRAELAELLVRGAGKAVAPAPKRKGAAAGESGTSQAKTGSTRGTRLAVRTGGTGCAVASGLGRVR